MRWDWSINPSYIVTWVALGLGLLWRASAFFSEMTAFRREFNEHVEDDRRMFERLETRMEDVRDELRAVRK